MPKIGSGSRSTLSDEQLSAAFTKILRRYLLKNADFIQQRWEDIIRTRVYNNQPVCYIRTEALMLGFNVRQFVRAFKIRVDSSGFNVDLNYVFDVTSVNSTKSPVMRKHLSKRGQTAIGDIKVDVSYPSGATEQQPLPVFMRTNRYRAAAGGEPKVMSQAVLAGKLAGSFRPPANNDSSYFAAYFIAGPNAKGNPEVYKRGGANPKNVKTARDGDKYTIILDFLTMIGLEPEKGSKPSGGSWTIKVITFRDARGLKASPQQCEVGGLLTATYRVYQLIQRGRPIMHERSWTYAGQKKTATRLADALRETRAFRRWNAAFWGGRHREEMESAGKIMARRKGGNDLETDLTASELVMIEAATAKAEQARANYKAQGYSDAEITSLILNEGVVDKTVLDIADRLALKVEAQANQEHEAAYNEFAVEPASEDDGEKMDNRRTRKQLTHEDREDLIQNAFLEALDKGENGKVTVPDDKGEELNDIITNFPDMAMGLSIERKGGKWIVTINASGGEM